MNKDTLLRFLRDGKEMSLGNQINLVALLSFPAILAQLSSIIMQYIDASMVGSLGAKASASIGLMSTSIWLFGGLCTSAATGFYVQVAHLIGSKNLSEAQNVLRQSITTTFFFVLTLTIIGLSIANFLPTWLGGDPIIRKDATIYFAIFVATLPLVQMKTLAGGMLRCSGNMKIPSLLNILMCALDILFNFLFIFPTRDISILGHIVTMPGLGLGVTGAALGTSVSIVITCILEWWFLLFRTPELDIIKTSGPFKPEIKNLKIWYKIGVPMAVEHALMNGAQIASTFIVAPLGIAAIAANAFGITIESLCYMPGYGIGEAATTLVGQSLGAKRENLANRFASITIAIGIIIMTFMGILMYIFAPDLMSIMTPDLEVQKLAVSALRIEAWAEPMFAASIVAYGVFVGRKTVFAPCVLNLFSIWAVRITLAWWLAKDYGLNGVWLAMCIELCFRGAASLILLRIKSKPTKSVSGSKSENAIQTEEYKELEENGIN
ncbi:MAG: MATE family efflux transporter [Bacteroidaceae bacterium]|nr:MATE family efflux transporter [Bacteroidaceae bacterium]